MTIARDKLDFLTGEEVAPDPADHTETPLDEPSSSGGDHNNLQGVMENMMQLEVGQASDGGDFGFFWRLRSSLALFETHHPINASMPIQLPNHSTTLVESVGNVRLSSTLILFDCLYVPTFKCNLLPVSK
ncbi:hypothetical protein LIER_06534 [Lithospermum erythrorhizon]|uniref:Uncharacterized protein n=1 Tax=Lithospermum erythrorhizon TaxID=34254 RepID=A0AAV3P9F2_LITER